MSSHFCDLFMKKVNFLKIFLRVCSNSKNLPLILQFKNGLFQKLENQATKIIYSFLTYFIDGLREIKVAFSLHIKKMTQSFGGSHPIDWAYQFVRMFSNVEELSFMNCSPYRRSIDINVLKYMPEIVSFKSNCLDWMSWTFWIGRLSPNSNQVKTLQLEEGRVYKTALISRFLRVKFPNLENMMLDKNNCMTNDDIVPSLFMVSPNLRTLKLTQAFYVVFAAQIFSN